MKPMRVLQMMLGLLLAGCLGSPADEEVQGAPAVLRPLALAGSADPIPPERWSDAPAGCEGRLDKHVRFAQTAGAPELLAVLDTNDRIVCVDALAAIRADLDHALREPSGVLGEGYAVQGDAFEPMRRSVTSTDPSPQPNRDGSEQAQGDPSPQPNAPANLEGDGAAQGDPSPQPNSPTDSSDTGGASTN